MPCWMWPTQFMSKALRRISLVIVTSFGTVEQGRAHGRRPRENCALYCLIRSHDIASCLALGRQRKAGPVETGPPAVRPRPRLAPPIVEFAARRRRDRVSLALFSDERPSGDQQPDNRGGILSGHAGKSCRIDDAGLEEIGEVPILRVVTPIDVGRVERSPTATISASCGLSSAVSGMMIPSLVFSSCSRRSTTKRSSNGRNDMIFSPGPGWKDSAAGGGHAVDGTLGGPDGLEQMAVETAVRPRRGEKPETGTFLDDDPGTGFGIFDDMSGGHGLTPPARRSGAAGPSLFTNGKDDAGSASGHAARGSGRRATTAM